MKEDEGNYSIKIYWAIVGGLFAIVQITDLIGYKSIKSIQKTSYMVFFSLRTIIELIKIAIVVLVWLDRTILYENISDHYIDLEQASEFNRLKIYSTINAATTFFLFIWTMQRMYTCYSTRNKTHIEQIKATHNHEGYYNQIDNFDHEGGMERNNLGQKIMEIIN